MIIVNREPAPYDGQAAVTIHGEARRVLPEIVAACLRAGQGEEAPSPAPK